MATLFIVDLRALLCGIEGCDADALLPFALWFLVLPRTTRTGHSTAIVGIEFDHNPNMLLVLALLDPSAASNGHHSVPIP